MQAKTELQKEIMSIDIPDLNAVIETWGFEKCIEHRAYRTTKSTKCLSCGSKFQGKPAGKTDKCPDCNRKLKVEDSRKLKDYQMVYVMVYDTHGRFQVNRFFQIKTFHKVGEQPRIYCIEIVQQWIQMNGKNEVVARLCGGMGFSHQENWHSELEIRSRDALLSKYNCWVEDKHVFPRKKVLPEMFKRGFVFNHSKFSPYELMGIICSNSIAETFLKTNQFDFLKATFDRPKQIKKYWSSIKITLRRGYKINHINTWLDYLELLSFFGKDLHSPRYICPVDLHKEHNRYVAKKREVDRLVSLEIQKRQLEKDEAAYKQKKSKFFGLLFTDGDLAVKVIETVQEVIRESDAHKHCVYTNQYHKKEDSLLFSATVKGKQVETIEVSISQAKILQSRGFGNKASEYNQRIIKLVEKHIPEIKKRRKKRKQIAA